MEAKMWCFHGFHSMKQNKSKTFRQCTLDSRGPTSAGHLGTSWKDWWTKKPKELAAIPVASTRGPCSRLPGLSSYLWVLTGLWCWKRLLTVPWTARRSNQSILKESNPECSFQGLMLKLLLQYFGHLMRRANSLAKTLMLGKIKGRRRRGQHRWDGWMASLTQWTQIWANSGK